MRLLHKEVADSGIVDILKSGYRRPGMSRGSAQQFSVSPSPHLGATVMLTRRRGPCVLSGERAQGWQSIRSSYCRRSCPRPRYEKPYPDSQTSTSSIERISPGPSTSPLPSPSSNVFAMQYPSRKQPRSESLVLGFKELEQSRQKPPRQLRREWS